MSAGKLSEPLASHSELLRDREKLNKQTMNNSLGRTMFCLGKSLSVAQRLPSPQRREQTIYAEIFLSSEWEDMLEKMPSVWPITWTLVLFPLLPFYLNIKCRYHLGKMGCMIRRGEKEDFIEFPLCWNLIIFPPRQCFCHLWNQPNGVWLLAKTNYSS